MAEQTTSVQPAASDPGKRDEQHIAAPAELFEELHERDEEILRLRDLLIGRDAELGAAKGRLAALEQHSQRFAGLVARIPIPGLGRVVAAVLRRISG